MKISKYIKVKKDETMKNNEYYGDSKEIQKDE